MTRKAGSRQEQILKLLLEQRCGLSIDEIAEQTGISRPAVQQHVNVLKQRGYVGKAARNKTGGRPVQIYTLTADGLEFFPKQYAWFGELLLQQLKKQLSPAATETFMANLGAEAARPLVAQLHDKTAEERLTTLLDTMQTLGYQVRLDTGANGTPVLNALHCVYHDIAQHHQEVCAFDRALMSTVLAREVEQTECMALGGQCCRFKLKQSG